jgi:hypothetical protein
VRCVCWGSVVSCLMAYKSSAALENEVPELSHGQERSLTIIRSERLPDDMKPVGLFLLTGWEVFHDDY